MVVAYKEISHPEQREPLDNRDLTVCTLSGTLMDNQCEVLGRAFPISKFRLMVHRGGTDKKGDIKSGTKVTGGDRGHGPNRAVVPSINAYSHSGPPKEVQSFQERRNATI